MRRFFVILVILAAAAAGAAWHYKVWPFAAAPTAANANKTVGVAPLTVKAAPVVRQDVPLTVALVGTVFANQSVAIRSRLDSQVTEVHFKDGDHITAGDILFSLDDRALKAQAAELAANIKRDQALLVSAETAFTRSEQLSARGYATKEKLDQDRANFQSQQATLNATKAALDNVQVQLGFTTIKAPITGRAGTINVTLGNNVRAGDATPLVTLNQVDPILVQFAVPQLYFDQIQQAMRGGSVAVTATRKESNTQLTGVLDYIDNTIDARNGTFVARARFDNPAELLWPGMFVTVTLNLGTSSQALVIPATALQGSEDQRFVFIIDPTTQKAVRKAVILDRITTDLAVLQSGVEVGDQVITDGLLRVTDGAAVKTQ